MMKATKRFLPTVAAAALMLLCGTAAVRADYAPTIDYTGGGFPDYNTGTYGYTFAVGSDPEFLTALATAPGGAVGNVRVWVLGTTTNIAEAYIDHSSSRATSNGHFYDYETIAPVLLAANTTYAIAWDNEFYGQAFTFGATTVSNDSNITLQDGIGSESIGAFPTSDEAPYGYTGPFFGPSFQVARAVPEPTAIISLGMGGMLLVGFRHRHRRSKK